MIQYYFLSLLFRRIEFHAQFPEFFHILLLVLVRDKRIEFIYAVIFFAGIILTLETIFDTVLL